MIINDDAIHALKTLEPGSVDLIVTDPPYGYSFMGKDWDKAVPSVEIWQECLRVLKPGAFCFVMSAPRSDVQNAMISRLMEAGFRLDFTPIYWTYASGFPKAGNIGKLVDKRNGVEREVIGEGKGRTGEAIKNHADIHGDDNYEWPGEFKITKGSSHLEGSYAGFQPKPAVEVIIVAMKPLSEKTYVDQALANGKGITWLDDARIPYAPVEPDKDKRTNNNFTNKGTALFENGSEQQLQRFAEGGRFPANLLVSDDVLNDGTITKSRDGGRSGSNANPMSWTEENKTRPRVAPNDSGSYSRYFDLDKWAQTLPFLIVPKASKSEKNRGLDGFIERDKPTLNKYTNPSEGRTAPKNGSPQKNHHPTVKPLKLMSYLITLGSRPGDIVLDPFVGSGTTVIAAKQLNRNSIGIEREPEYAEIAQARLDHISIKLPEEPVTQPPVTMEQALHQKVEIQEQLRMF